MNKEYIYINGQIVVTDENGMTPPREYSDNITEILVTENLIEKIENELAGQQKGLANRQTPTKIVIRNIIINLCMWIGTPLIIGPAMINFLGVTQVVEAGILVGMNMAIAISLAMTVCLGVLIGIPSSFGIWEHYKIERKEAKGIENTIGFLTKELAEQKERLNTLQSEKSKEKESDFSQTTGSKKVSDKEVLENLRSHIMLYYNSGVKEAKYIKWQQKKKN